MLKTDGAVNSVGECFLDAEEVISSNLIRPTMNHSTLQCIGIIETENNWRP